jgi:SRSO17 transposase
LVHAVALIDRELYLPEKWTGDWDRCRAAGIGDEAAFATKPKLAEKMIARAREAGIPFSWVAGDEVYGGNPDLRQWLEEQGIPYVMATACSDVIGVRAGQIRADKLAALVPEDGWQRLSCADGSKGPRLYDWALLATGSPRHHLPVRRPAAFHQHWSDWRRYRQASARKSHYARRLGGVL